MSHAVVLVVTPEQPTENILDPILLPWHEYECTGIEAFTEWMDETEGCRKSWEEGGYDKYRAPDGILRYRFDEYYRIPNTIGTSMGGGGSSSHYDPIEKYGHVKVHVTNKEEHPDFLEFAKEEGYGPAPKGATGEVGRLTNPNAKWDWWQIGGRWGNRLVQPDGEKVDFLQKKFLDLDAQRQARADLKKKWIDVGISEIKDLCKEEILAIWAKICDQMSLLKESYEIDKKEDKPRLWDWIKEAAGEETAADYSAELRDAAEFILSKETRQVSHKIGGFFLGDVTPITEPDPYAHAAKAEAFDWVQAVVIDGQWVEQGEMGWWGYSNQDMTDGKWTEMLMKKIEEIPDDHYLCVVDYHI